MKKIKLIASFSIVAVTLTSTALATTFTSQAAMDAYAERQRKLVLETNENFEKGKTDDAALKEAIISLPKLMEPNRDAFNNMVKNMTLRGITRERQIQAQEEIIREILPTVGKNETSENIMIICLFLQVLNTYQNYDIFPILQECMDSHNEYISTRATRLYNKIKENMQEQPKPTSDETPAEEPPTPEPQATPNPEQEEPPPTITDSPQPEPVPPTIADEAELPTQAIADEVAQPIQDTPPEQPEKTSSNKPLLWLSIIAFLAILGGMIVWRKKP